MPTRETSSVIASEPAVLFELSQEYARRLEWDPFLREARLVGGAPRAGVGVHAWCVSRHGLGMETKYVTFDPPRVVAVRMTRGPRLLAAFASSWRFEARPEGGTRVRIRVHVRARPRWLAWLIEPIVLGVFLRETRGRLAGLARVAVRTPREAVATADC
jgi:hypothetical protein